MESRRLGKSGLVASEVGFGAWAVGGSWGDTDDGESLAAMHAAVDAGVTFFDTADVYGDGRSERLIGRLLRERESRSSSRRSSAARRRSSSSNLSYEKLRGWLERSRENLGVEVVDLVQLHCPPWEAYYTPSVFEACDRLVEERLVRAYGVSVEKVEEALKAIEYPGVSTVQIIFNVFRQRPAELLFGEARRRDVGVIARVPLASGLLTGKLSRRSQFAADDHRAFNRHGEAFDVGETFSGVELELGLDVGRGAQGAHVCRADAHAARPSLDPRFPRRLDRDPRREDTAAGSWERERRRASASSRARPSGHRRALLDADRAPVHQRW